MQNSNISIHFLTAFDDLVRVSELIYNTDPYIYPEAFGHVDNAKSIISDMIRKDCGFFSAKNIIVAYADETIAGIAVLVKNHVSLIPTSYSNLQLPVLFSKVRDQYFNEMNQYLNSDSPVYLACLCVAQEFRGYGIGGAILEYIIDDVSPSYANTSIKLHVLADNYSAIHLYSKHGFQVIKTVDGFSMLSEKPKCYEMAKTIPY